MIARRRSFQAWLALAVTTSYSVSCIDAFALPISTVAVGGKPSSASTVAFGYSGSINNNKLRMSSTSSSQTSSWSKLTVPQLKSQLKQWKLPVSGVKAELIQRLEDHQAAGEALTAESQTSVPQETQSSSRKKMFPPPKDETEIQVAEKEVQETVRMLEGMKLTGGVTKSGTNSQPQQPTSVAPDRQLSRQQQQEKKMMSSLKQSLKQSQQQKNNPKESEKKQEAASPEQVAHAEKLLHYTDQLRLKPANDLKVELLSLKLSQKGRKPELVQRLAEYYVARAGGGYVEDEDDTVEIDVEIPELIQPSSKLDLDVPVSFAGISSLSANAANALHQAFGDSDGTTMNLDPTPIQSVAISKLFYPPNPSALLHAPTGSGKTIAYLLPITETLWKEVEQSKIDNLDVNNMGNGVALVLLPTRELAAQVAGVATVLAPPGMVKLVSRPMDLMNFWKDEVDHGEEFAYNEQEGNDADESTGRKYQPRILVGSAKSISTSLFGDKKMPGTPTNKPQGKQLLSSTRWLVMDEVDRLLSIKKTRSDKKSRHEKPAALLAAAIARLTVGRVQVIAASATVGRPLRRELSRVLGLHSSECPETLRGDEDATKMQERINDSDEVHVGRAVKIPSTVRNYVLPVDGSTSGSLLTSASFSAKNILQPSRDVKVSSRKVLMVLTRNCDIKVHNALGALRHFGISPEPQSLLDVLEADGADRLVEAHRKVSRVEGVGGRKQQEPGTLGDSSSDAKEEGYLLVTHEDNVRGLHLDGLDAVIVVGRPGSPDEYTHIAGRTGRAGRNGSVLNIVSFEQAAALASWTKMLGVDFLPVDESELAGIIDE